MSINLEQFHQIFFEESLENIEVIETTLLGIQTQKVPEADEESVNTIFRAAHSLKGGSGTFGFTDITGFTHLIETLLDQVREKERALNTELITALLSSCDHLRIWIDKLQQQQVIDPSTVAPLKATFENMLKQPENKKVTEEPSETFEKTHPTISTQDNAKTDVSVISNHEESFWKIFFQPEPHILMNGNDPLRLLLQLKNMGKIVVNANTKHIPSFGLIIVDECYVSWDIQLFSSCPQKDIEEIFEWVIDDAFLSITRVEIASSEKNSTEEILGNESQLAAINPTEVHATALDINKSEKPLEEMPINQLSSSSSIRVDTKKIDHLMDLVGELVITQSMLSELGHGNNSESVNTEKDNHLAHGLDQLLQNTRALQESVMKIRMLPISFAFNRFPRMIHDLSIKCNKKVVLKTLGENTELDKTVMEKIGDPLVHLVRNAIDHGIETSEERIRNNKAEAGKIILNAFQKGGNIIIEISDDGKGINPDIIAQKAIEKGLIEDSRMLTKEQIYDLIFEPGFSTATNISDISGRGVGMDVVKKNIHALGGDIEIESEEGKGSTFRVHLPLTLAILEGQLIQAGGETMVIPLSSIIESLEIRDENIERVSGNQLSYRLREKSIPIIALHSAFDLPKKPLPINKSLIVVIEHNGKIMGLLIDELLAQQQVVIKSLEKNYRSIPGISGATILGDGSVALILDIASVIQLSIKNTDANRQSAA